jgi:hypothetical protein
MSDNSWSDDSFPATSLRRTTLFHPNSCPTWIDSIFFYQEENDSFNSLFLISIEMVCVIVSYHRDSYCSEIVPIRMESLYIVPSRSTLIDITTLSYEVVICYIRPSLHLGMIGVDIAYKCRIIKGSIEIFSGMMEDDFIDFFCRSSWIP